MHTSPSALYTFCSIFPSFLSDGYYCLLQANVSSLRTYSVYSLIRGGHTKGTVPALLRA